MEERPQFPADKDMARGIATELYPHAQANGSWGEDE